MSIKRYFQSLVFVSLFTLPHAFAEETSYNDEPAIEYETLEPATLQPYEAILQALSEPPPIDYSDHDVLALDDRIKALLDREIAPIGSKKLRLETLHRILYLPQYRHIRYSPNGTKTAIDTFYSGEGNCISLANLFVAAARHVGLRAKFQSVRLDREWRPRDGYFEVPGHVNVIVDLRGERATIEFNAAYYRDTQKKEIVKRVISDKQAKAEYYNNLAVDALGEKHFDQALVYFDKAIAVYPKIDFLWSNLGVAHKLMGNMTLAEQSYQKALKINPRNKSTIGNIYILYKEMGEQTKSTLYREKAEKYARKNPYHLQKIANGKIETGAYSDAIKLLRKAIRIYKLDPDFHHDLAVAYYYNQDFRRSAKALEKAKSVSSSEEYKDRFQRKINALSQHRTASR